MNLSPVFLMKFKNTVERILHVPGNYKGGILEMAVVLDHNVSREIVQDFVPQILRCLKMHSEIFRNVRLNLVQWEDDEQISNQVAPMSMAGMVSYYENYQCQSRCKDLKKLMQYLKVFQARAKLIILVTNGANEEGSEENLKTAMLPFLDKKLMQVVIGEDVEIRYR